MKSDRIFHISCWVLGITAFSQLLVAGMALAVRFEESREVRVVEKEVPKWVPIKISVPVASELPPPVVERPKPTLPPVPEPVELAVPKVADPRSELLVNQGRTARIAGDMGLAIVKLEEARAASPQDPNVLFELGLVHELMGVYDRAAAYYQEVFALGTTGAGQLYQAAAAKLRDGFELPTDLLGKLALGRVQIFNEPISNEGQKVVLTIPVEKAPGADVEASEIEIVVTFFNRDHRGQISQLVDQSWASSQWVSLPFDWAGGQETLRMDYAIPRTDPQTQHLFGQPEYYGQVVTLQYKGEVLDVQAWPRDLAARIGQTAPAGQPHNDFPEFLDHDILPPDFDPDIPLLNTLPLPE